ncbi:hypothetical protein ACU4GI_32965 [Cupriavidus basilensis]
MPDGSEIFGAAAREARLKAAGGVEKLLRRVARNAADNAAQQAFALGQRTTTAAPANETVAPTVRRLRRAL